MSLYESGENYLETIYILSKSSENVRSIDIAHELDYSKPSVSRAMGILKTQEYITIDASGKITLTEKGKNTAQDIYDRHNTIALFLIKTLDIAEEDAFKDACRIEHILSSNVFEKMKLFVSNH